MNPRIFAAGLLIVGLILVDIRQHVRIISMGYEIESLGENRDGLKNRNRELLIEAESLSALDRIESIAIRRLGMIHPEENQIRIVPMEEGAPWDPEPSEIKMARNEG